MLATLLASFFLLIKILEGKHVLSLWHTLAPQCSIFNLTAGGWI